MIDYAHPELKRVMVRSDGAKTSDNQHPNVKTPIVGWFYNKYNVAGWVIHELGESDKEWLSGLGLGLENVYRVVSNKGHTSIVKFRMNKGTVAWIDDRYYLDTDKVRWESFTAYKQVYLDQI